jgi:hypothetical protein
VAGKRDRGVKAEDYVRTSITEPQDFVVKGYPNNVMPKDYREQLSPEQLSALVEYLLRPQ